MPVDVATVLQVEDLSVRYGPVVALDRVSLTVRPGEVVALAGENGAGKSTLIRCVAGDIRPEQGRMSVLGETLDPGARISSRSGIAVVWQDLALCDNLDIASNVMLGAETRRLMFSETRFHSKAAEVIERLGIGLPSTSTIVAHLSGGQRQLVAVARAMRDNPHLLILDEPTASLGVAESARVESLAASLPAQGTTVMIVSHDVEQMFRLADRIVVLRRGKVVAEVLPEESHPDEVAALLSGQPAEGSPRRQLSRLQDLADQLASASPSSGLTLIISALAAALGIGQLCVHVREGSAMRLAGHVGLPAHLVRRWADLQVGAVVRSGALREQPASGDSWGATLPSGWEMIRRDARQSGFKTSWSLPFTSAQGDSGVITILSEEVGEPTRDDIELASLYAGYAANALERDRLLGELTVRNRVLETIREVLQALAGPAALEVSLQVALRALQAGLGARYVAVVTRRTSDADPAFRAWVGPDPDASGSAPSDLLEVARRSLGGRPTAGSRPAGSRTAGSNGAADAGEPRAGQQYMVAEFPAPEGRGALVVRWDTNPAAFSPAAGVDVADRRAVIDDAASSIRLALEREESERAQRETMALRSSQALQRQFLSWLSHELRTPLTAICGYASSLMAPDVDWDAESQRRFLERIDSESARLGRLVEDLLDFSAIDAGLLRLDRDWCELPLVLEAARSCLPSPLSASVALSYPRDVPVVWADHDRLEQVFVNLFDNAVRHNPAGTTVNANVSVAADGAVTITVSDNGRGITPERLSSLAGPGERRGRSGGSGLGLSIAKGIVEAHGGQLVITTSEQGTLAEVRLANTHAEAQAS